MKNFTDLIFQTIEEFFELKIENKDPSFRILDQLEIESIEFVDLIFQIERRSNLQIDLNDLADMLFIKRQGRRFKEITVEDLNIYLIEISKDV